MLITKINYSVVKMTNTELCRKNLYARIGVDDRKVRSKTEVSAEIARMNAKLHEVVALAKSRLIMGGIRYGSKWEHEQLMEYMQEKFDTYKETGNYEMLIDFLNFIPIEGVLKTHPKFHFKPEDRKSWND